MTSLTDEMLLRQDPVTLGTEPMTWRSRPLFELDPLTINYVLMLPIIACAVIAELAAMEVELTS